MIATAADPDRSEVQRLVVHGYTLNRSRHFILRVRKSADARTFLAALVDGRFIANASLENPDVTTLAGHGYCPINIGFTYCGLQRLGLPAAYLRVFQEKAPAYAEGAVPRASKHLADTGASAVQWWEKKRFEPERAHVLLTMHADEDSILDAFTTRLIGLPGADGLQDWRKPVDGAHLTDKPDRTVHFGFLDGISNPAIKGFHEEKKALRDAAGNRTLHEPGEFLLGYENDEGFNPWLLVNPSSRPNPWLPPLNRAPALAEFFRNGSFAAFRKMEQDERAFRDSLAEWAKGCGESVEYVKAKLSGRWADGSVVTPDGRPPPAERNDFNFSDDPRGEGCPFGSHIRRMNPRNDPVVPFRRRPLIRRGMPYGPIYEKDEPEGRQRGLLGLFFCASLEDQFEHLLSEWGNANPMGPCNRGTAKDPLIGNHENPDAVFDIPMKDEKLRQLDGFRPFVTTRGTLYAFFPSLTALARIARRGMPAP
jgi:deferrochelatase/peroxidase EfeB